MISLIINLSLLHAFFMHKYCMNVKYFLQRRSCNICKVLLKKGLRRTLLDLSICAYSLIMCVITYYLRVYLPIDVEVCQAILGVSRWLNIGNL